MVVVVTDSVLVAGRRPSGLDASQDALVGECCEGVVHRLTRDRTDLGPNGSVDVVGGAVRLVGHRAQNRQALSRDLHTVLAQKRIVVDGVLSGHDPNLCPMLE
jgi:hypothetical protein